MKPEEFTKVVAAGVTAGMQPLSASLGKIEAALDKAKDPSHRKALADAVGMDKVERAIKGGEYLRAVASGKAVLDYVENAGTDGAHFTYSVPTEIIPDVIASAVQSSILLAKATSFPQRAQTVHRLVYSSGFTMSFPDEAAAPTVVVGSYGRVIFAKKRGTLLVACSNDLLEGSVVDLYDEFTTRFGQVYGTTVDTYGFNDNTSPFTGILSGAGQTVTMGSSKTMTDITCDELLEDLNEMTGKLTAALSGAVWVMSPTMRARIATILKDTTGQPLNNVWGRRESGDDPMIRGYLLDSPYILSDNMPTSTAAASHAVAALFLGKLSDYHIGKASEFAVKSSQVANETIDTTPTSAFSADLTYFLGQAKWSQNIALSNSFVKLETSAS